jgi:hypothetical protein
MSTMKACQIDLKLNVDPQASAMALRLSASWEVTDDGLVTTIVS